MTRTYSSEAQQEIIITYIENSLFIVSLCHKFLNSKDTYFFLDMSDIMQQVLRTNIYIQPFNFFLAIITNIFNIRILCSRALRPSPCTHYFLAYAVFSIIYTCLMCPTQFLRGFDINWANGKFGCKIHFYILFLIPVLANLMLIFASFDRYCSSLQSCRLHSKSTIRTARFTIIYGTVLSAIYMLPMLIIYNWNESIGKCEEKVNLLTIIYVFSQVFLYHILAPLLMFIFGLLTINNIRRQSTRAIPLMVSMRGRRTEGQLTRMLILQVTVHMLLVLPFGVTYAINTFNPSTRTRNMIALRLAFATWQQCDYFVSFFLYIFSGSVYRRELFRILRFNNDYNTPVQFFVGKRKDIYREMPRITATIKTRNGMINGAII